MLYRHVNGDHNRFSAAVDTLVKEVDVALSRRRHELGQEWNDIGKGWEDLGEIMAHVGINQSSTSDDNGSLCLNVGGSNVSVRRSAFKSDDGSFATCILTDLFFTATWDKRLPPDSDCRIVLNESPACVRHMVHTLLKGSGKDSRNLALDSSDDAPADQQPILSYVSRARGLPSVSIGITVTGGKSFLPKDTRNVHRLTAMIQGWCPGQPKELNLLYRA